MLRSKSFSGALLALFISLQAFGDYEAECRKIDLEFWYYKMDWLNACLSWSQTWDAKQMTNRLGGSAYAVTLLSLKIENAHRACKLSISEECIALAKEIPEALPPLAPTDPLQENLSRLESQIKKHVPEPLTYRAFFGMLKEGKISPEQANRLIDYAYSVKNPILFRRAQKLISPNEYSLNFLWIHKDKLAAGGHMFGSDNTKLSDQIIKPISDWQSKQPEANINFWYDGAIVDNRRLEATTKYIRDSASLNLGKVRFRDIRSIPLVGENAKWFDTAIPVYFRVDFAKALTGDHVLRNDRLPFAVNIDSDVVAVVREQLFDKPTLEALESLGYVFGGSPAAAQENSFIMLHQSPSMDTLPVHLEKVILPAMKRYEQLKALAAGDFIMAQSVFEQYDAYRKFVKSNFEKRKGLAWGDDAAKNGKPMILPNSRYSVGIGGYSEEMMAKLRNALLNVPTK